MKKKIGTFHCEWDDVKNEINIKKHGISFETAALVFTDQRRIELYDEWHSADEERYITIGLVEKILFVVYTSRNDAIRFISARVANERERGLYCDDND